MPSLDTQIAGGALVCPRTRQTLHREGSHLRSSDGTSIYPIVDGVPILLCDPGQAAAMLKGDAERMVHEYREGPNRATGGLRAVGQKVMGWVARRALAARTVGVESAFQKLFEGLDENALCVSVGGGPTRVDPRLINLNLGRFANVDVVCDAYVLPYADGKVDGVHCEAVLEHLEYPDRAVAEMNRVLRPGRRVYAATPFLQAYHGYPDHFQNFTMTGHRRLFERAGFEVEDAGCAVGPLFALRDLVGQVLRYASPRPLARWMFGGWMLASLPALALDRRLAGGAAGIRVASLTYLLARKRP
jgi:SAM-dependent methyltransferase